jgi:hypothetical protein
MSAALIAGFIAVGVWAAGRALGGRGAEVLALVGPEPGVGTHGGAPTGPLELAQRWVRAARSAVAGRLRPAARGEALLVLQALEVAAEQSPEPLGGDLREVVERVRLGTPIEEALERWAGSRPTPEVRLAVGVLRMHRAVGGMVAPALENLARTMRERRSAARELRSLTAQARLSGAILGLLPLGFFCFLWLTSRADMVAALRTPLGRGAVLLGLLLDGAAFAWIRRLLRVGA